MTLDNDPIGTSARHARTERRLPPDAQCEFCGHRNPVALKATRSTLEEHHVAGQANDPDLTVVHCLNCHRSLSDAQLSAGVLARDPDDVWLDRLIRTLRSLAIWLNHLAEAFVTWADKAAAHRDALDWALPEWRTLLESTR